MSEEQLLAARIEREQIEVWALAGVAAMLERVRSVCIFEYNLLIDELKKEAQ